MPHKIIDKKNIDVQNIDPEKEVYDSVWISFPGFADNHLKWKPS